MLSTNPANTDITVKHEEIPGFMPAMTMSYKVKDPAVVQELKPGDIIAADLVTKNDGNVNVCAPYAPAHVEEISVEVLQLKSSKLRFAQPTSRQCLFGR